MAVLMMMSCIMFVRETLICSVEQHVAVLMMMSCIMFIRETLICSVEQHVAVLMMMSCIMFVRVMAPDDHDGSVYVWVHTLFTDTCLAYGQDELGIARICSLGAHDYSVWRNSRLCRVRLKLTFELLRQPASRAERIYR